MKQREYHAGDIILKEGDPSDVVFKIVSGNVEVFKEHEGQTNVLGVMRFQKVESRAVMTLPS